MIAAGAEERKRRAESGGEIDAQQATQSAIYILFLKAGIACKPTKNLFARAVKPAYQGCISFAQPFGCVASRVSVFLVSMKLKLLAESPARSASMS
jgi:hypothetical protein